MSIFKDYPNLLPILAMLATITATSIGVYFGIEQKILEAGADIETTNNEIKHLTGRVERARNTINRELNELTHEIEKIDENVDDIKVNQEVLKLKVNEVNNEGQ